MDRKTVFSKTTKGLMEATGKTSRLSRSLRSVLKEVDGKATVDGLQTRLGKLSEDELDEALQSLLKDDYVREFTTGGSSVTPTAARTAPPPPPPPPSADGEEDLDFTAAIPTTPKVDKKAEEAAKKAAEAAAEAKAKAEAAARAKAAAEAKAKAEAEAKAKAEAAARAKAAAEAKAKADAEARAKAEAEARAKREAEERARKEAEEKAHREAEELRAKLEEERKAREEAERERKEAAEKAQREADELRAKLEEERKAREEAELRAKEEAERRAREEAERKAKEEAERKEREEAERKAKEEAERKEKEEAERKAREEAERKAKEEAERKAKEEAERREKEEAERRAKEEAENKAKEEAERKAKEEAERKEKEESERKAKEDAERKAKEEAERKANEEAEREEREEAERRAKEEAENKAKEEAARKEREEAERKDKEDAEARAREKAGDAEGKAKEEAERKDKDEAERRAKEKEEAESKAKEEAERKAKEEADAKEKEAAEQKAKDEAERKDKEEAARKEREEAERKDKEEAARRRQEEEEKAARETAEQSQTSDKSGRSLDDLVKIEIDFDAASIPAPEVKTETAPPRDSADDVMLKEIEARERREAEEKAQIKAEELAHRKAEEEAKRAEEERARKDEEGQASAAAPEREFDQLEEQALLKSQEAETERHFAEMEKELEAEKASDKGRKEVREPERGRDKKEIGERIRAAAAAKEIEAKAVEVPFAPLTRAPVKWGKPVALVLFLLLVIGLVMVQFISFDGHIPRFEKLAGAYLQQPVKIKALHLSLVPTPHWRLDGVSVGSEGQLKVEKIKASAGPGNLFGDKLAFSSIELESPVLSDLGMAGLLFGKPEGQDFKVANIIVKNGKLESKSFIIPALDAKIAMAENGAWKKIALETPDHNTSLLFIPEGDGAQLEVDTNVFSMPFDASFFLENFSAKGVLRRGELRLNELKGGIYGGFLTGSAVLKWDTDWSMTGDVSVRAMDPGRFAPALFEEGALEGKAVYAMRAKSYDELFAAPRLEGNFEIRKGVLLGVDLGRLLQGGGVGGKTTYAELTGGFVREGGKTQVQQIHLTAGPVSAGGTIDADAAKRINGRFVVELKSPVAKARSNLTLSGTLRDPRFGR